MNNMRQDEEFKLTGETAPTGLLWSADTHHLCGAFTYPPEADPLECLVVTCPEPEMLCGSENRCTPGLRETKDNRTVGVPIEAFMNMVAVSCCEHRGG